MELGIDIMGRVWYDGGRLGTMRFGFPEWSHVMTETSDEI